jgi:hypothetical protein
MPNSNLAMIVDTIALIHHHPPPPANPNQAILTAHMDRSDENELLSFESHQTVVALGNY